MNIKFLNQFYILFVLIISSCASVDTKVSPLKYNEVLGVGYEHFDGKLFQISCKGNSEASEDYVKEKCLKEISAFVHDKGFEYFSVLSQDGQSETQTAGVLIGNVVYPASSKYHSKNLVITVLKKDELNKFKNFYKVADYFKINN